MLSSWLVAAAGGAMIGAAAALLLAAHGQIAGISGISGALLRRTTRGRGWRLAFLGGLAAAGLAAHGVAPATIGAPIRSLPLVIAPACSSATARGSATAARAATACAGSAGAPRARSSRSPPS